MAGIVNLVRGLYVCVPRDAVQAAGFYNTLLRSDDAALVVEVLNGYRKKLPQPANLGDFALPLGVPEILRTGTDLTPIRSSKEKLSGGGKPSGPLSFLRVYDQVANVVKSGGKTRRAAKMNTIRDWHGDVEEFIDAVESTATPMHTAHEADIIDLERAYSSRR